MFEVSLNQFFKKYNTLRDYSLLSLLLLLSLILMFYGDKNENNAGIHVIAFALLDKINTPILALQQVLNTENENSLLRKENASLQMQLSQLKEMKQENGRLRELLGFKSMQTYRTIPAKVIGYNQQAGISAIQLEISGEAKIKKNMPVVNAQGLVGKVLQVSGHYATCQLVTDRNFSAAARVQRSRVEAIYQAKEEEVGQLIGVHHRSDVQEDDVVVTSGMNSLFPAGLVLGTVTRIEKDERELFQKVYVKSAVEFDKLEEVLIIDAEDVL
jgi:rod shape-determining protein MreC